MDIATKNSKIDAQTTGLHTDLKKAHTYIYSIDFSLIVEKLVSQQKWLRREAEQACLQYRNYLWLLKKYKTEPPLPPSRGIDEFWHHHILDTKQYITDCDTIFHSYLHHVPYYRSHQGHDLMQTTNAFAHMCRLYQLEFGTPLKPVFYRFKPLLKFFIK